MSNFYKKLIRPAMFGFDAETAHELGIESLRLGLSTDLAQRMVASRYATESFGPIERFGLKFANPLGVAAGFDKNGIAVNQLAALGFGFVEVGTVTYRPQKGNDRPRLFRLPDDGALINRLGFNNDGAELVARRLKGIRRRCVVGVNIGKNKDVPNEEAVENYLAAFDHMHPVADYVAINVSSPNTPGLRDLQRAENLEELIKALSERNRVLSSAFRRPPIIDEPTEGGTQNVMQKPPEGGTQNAKPLLLKIAPDLSDGEIEEIVDVSLRLGISGIIATNTTISRQGLRTANAADLGPGGLSGRPLTKRSTEVIQEIHACSKGRMPIIGVGGVLTAEDAFAKISAGASLVQAYTGFVYGGPSFAHEVNRGLLKLLRDKGFSSLDMAVGCGL